MDMDMTWWVVGNGVVVWCSGAGVWWAADGRCLFKILFCKGARRDAVDQKARNARGSAIWTLEQLSNGPNLPQPSKFDLATNWTPPNPSTRSAILPLQLST